MDPNIKFLQYVVLGLFSIAFVERGLCDYDFHQFQRYENIKEYLNSLNKKHPNTVTVEYPMLSSEKRGIPLVKISGSPVVENVIVFIEAGIHGREWLSSAVAMYVINELAENGENMTAEIDWHIAPLVNPDGYEYSHLYDESWKKTKSKYNECLGVDPNQNFEFHWERSYDCDEDYSGPRPFSEPESQFIKNELLKYQKRVKLYLSLHCCGGRIYHPWGFTDIFPEDINPLLDIAYKVQKAMYSERQITYDVGNPISLTYKRPGSSYDWAKGVAGVNLSFIIELAGENGSYTTSEDEIEPVGDELFEGLKAFHQDLMHKYVDN